MVPAIAGRLDHGRIAAVGHSMGGHTVGVLLGARLTERTDETARDLSLVEPRIKTAVLLAAPGNGSDLGAVAARNYSFMNPDYSHGLRSVAGYDARETDREDPDCLEAVRRMTRAYLRSALQENDPAWAEACEALKGPAGRLGRIDIKPSRLGREGS